MKIQKILTDLTSHSLDITIDSKILSTRFFKMELEKYKSLCVDWNTSEDFIYFWETFFLAKELEIKRIYNAMTTEYNALENYDKTEMSTTNTENSASGENTTIALNDTINTLEKTTYNSNSLHVAEKTTTKPSDIKSSGNSESENIVTYENRTRGNIGITTSQQMLKSEYEIRLIGMYELLTKWFINNFAY